jgi:hypothetical protein
MPNQSSPKEEKRNREKENKRAKRLPVERARTRTFIGHPHL